MTLFKRIGWAGRYAWLTVWHKWYVLRAGILLGGVPLWRLLIHDLSKFGPWEMFAYGRQFFGDRGDALGFTVAWTHHQNTNPHHWEWWIPRTAHNRGGFTDGEPLPMPNGFAREMVADWLGASRAYESAWPTSRATWKWLSANYATLRLHPLTRERTDAALAKYFGGHE